MLKKTADGYEERFLDGKMIDDVRKINNDMKVHIISDYYSFNEILELINSL